MLSSSAGVFYGEQGEQNKDGLSCLTAVVSTPLGDHPERTQSGGRALGEGGKAKEDQGVIGE